MTDVSHDSIFDAAMQACHPDADLLFISCTALRAAQVIHKIEAKINKPVISSNQALIWHALKLLQRPFQVPVSGGYSTSKSIIPIRDYKLEIRGGMQVAVSCAIPPLPPTTQTMLAVLGCVTVQHSR